MSSGNRIEFRHSLAFRLTLWYAAVFTVSSCVAFLIFYLLITSVIRDRTDRDLLEQAEKFSTLLATNGVEAVKRIAAVEAQAAGERKIFIRFLTRDGSVFSSSNMAYWPDARIPRKIFKDLIDGKGPIFDTMIVPGRAHEVRVFYGMIGPGVLLQLGHSMEDQTRIVDAFKRMVLATMALLLALAAVVGWFMARQALSGLGEVTRTADRISGSKLGDRVPVTGRGDEIDRLATTFNQMLDRIQQLVMGIKQMSDNIAHDLKSPITRIRGLAEVTLTADASLGEYRNMTASTIEECDRLLEMINTMLLISKTEAGTESFKHEELDMTGLVRDACELFRPLAEDKGIGLSCRGGDGCRLRGDIGMIQRMIANLLDNAIKYTPGPGTVDVTVRAGGGGSVEVEVADTGPGVSESDLPHLFERFYRGDPSRAQSGSGLGLSLARAIAQAHGGDIGVSNRRGKGSTFTVTLPASRPAPAPEVAFLKR